MRCAHWPQDCTLASIGKSAERVKCAYHEDFLLRKLPGMASAESHRHHPKVLFSSGIPCIWNRVFKVLCLFPFSIYVRLCDQGDIDTGPKSQEMWAPDSAPSLCASN